MSKLTDQQIANVAKASGWQFTSDIAIAVAVALAESGGETSASHKNTNGSVDRGLFQVNSIHGYPAEQLFTPLGNGRAAFAVWKSSGWRAWSTYKSQAYRVFLPRGLAVAGKASDSGRGDPASGGVHDASPAEAANIALAPYKKLADFLTGGNTWTRLGYFLAGSALLLYAFFTVDAVRGGIKKAGKTALTIAAVVPK